MARSEKQKLKLLYLRDYLLRYSDQEHPVTTKQIIASLAENGISAERKSVYSDLEALREYGMDIVQDGAGYYCAGGDFELPELKLLVDSVQASKFITEKKTQALISKIEGLASVYQAGLLNRQVYVRNRVKSMNESIYYNVDEIYSAIAKNRKIRFKYFEYNTAKEKVFRHDGAVYEVSPYALTWDDENYYLVAYDSAAEKVKHYRVDKMSGITAAQEAREGAEDFGPQEMAAYSGKVFRMFSGRERTVRLRVADALAGVIIDRFGKEAMLVPDGEGFFAVQADVVVSPQFFGWVSSFAGDVVITAPQDVADEMRAHVEKLLKSCK
jgi:predicted DNA-binding transcriptional regulator YafY